jgi:hypothetical protein
VSVTGGCNYGAVRFEVTEPLIVAHDCLSGRCQRGTGTAASLNVRTEPGSVRITASPAAPWR